LHLETSLATKEAGEYNRLYKFILLSLSSHPITFKLQGSNSEGGASQKPF
jgi:hypothetical protein